MDVVTSSSFINCIGVVYNLEIKKLLDLQKQENFP